MRDAYRRTIARSLIALVPASIIISSPAKADFGCSANPAGYLAVDGQSFLVMIEGKHVKVCSLQANSGDISADICKIWLAQVMTARSSGRPVSFSFHETQASGATSCSTLRDWALTSAYYLEAL